MILANSKPMISCSAIALAARLKTLGVESVMAERNAQVGDNWTLRYDCLQFHVPTSVCELPYMCKQRLRLDRIHFMSPGAISLRDDRNKRSHQNALTTSVGTT